MRLKEIERLMKENKEYLKILEDYDRTGILALAKIKRTFTLDFHTVSKLHEMAKNSDSNMSKVIENLVRKS